MAVVVALTLSLAIAPAAMGTTADQSVAYQLDPQHDGDVTAAPVSAPLAQLWSKTLSGATSYPLIVNGVVYVTANPTSGSGTTLYALNLATGATVWSKSLGGTYHWSGLAYDGGRVFAVNDGGLLSAFDPAAGTTVWSKQLPGQYMFSSPPTASQGIVYVGGAGSGGTLYAVREVDGSVLWTQSVENGDHSSPAVDSSAVYVTYPGPQDYAFDREHGTPLWHHSGSSEGGGGRTPVVAAGTVFGRDFLSSDVLLSATDGSVAGAFAAGPAPAVGGGMAYELNGGTLTAVAQSGQGANAWQFTGDGHLDTAPLLVGSLVVVGSSLGELYALDGSGNIAWSGNVGAAIPAPDEQNVSQPLTGLGGGEGAIVVPAGSTLVAYASSGATSGIPAMQTSPTVVGTPVTGQPSAADVGTWSGVPSSYSYQWQLCDASGGACNDVVGATSQSYSPASTDAGHTLRVAVTSSNANGTSSEVVSAASPPVASAGLANMSAPAISGSPLEAHTLTASPGTWSGSPTSYAYQWLYCDQGSCAPESGATASTYTPDPSDIGYQLEVQVTASDAGGHSVSSSSAPTAVISTLGPANTTPPTIAGAAQAGSVLTASLGSWTGNPSAYDLQWFSCDPQLISCSVIAGATATSYVPSAGDVGQVLVFGVVASNAQGDSEPAFSDPSDVVVSASPAQTPAPAATPPAAVPAGLTAHPAASLSTAPTALAPNGKRVALPSGTRRSVIVHLRCNKPCRVRVTVTASRAKGLRGMLAQRTLTLGANRLVNVVLRLTAGETAAISRLKHVVLHVRVAITINGRTRYLAVPYALGR